MNKISIGVRSNFNSSILEKSLKLNLSSSKYEITKSESFNLFSPTLEKNIPDILICFLRLDDFGEILEKFITEKDDNFHDLTVLLDQFLKILMSDSMNTKKTFLILPTIDTTNFRNINLSRNINLLSRLNWIYCYIINYVKINIHSITVIDLLYELKKVPEFDAKNWLWFRFPYTIETTKEISIVLTNYVELTFGKIKKLVVIDLDNTIWGGIVGEDGIDKIKIGHGDPVSESYLMFQKHLKSLKNAGFLLAICSKNNEDLVRKAFKERNEMILKWDDFITTRINWKNKVENINSISQELNLPLNSIVFIDDSPLEQDLIRTYLPEISILPMAFDPIKRVEVLKSFPDLLRIDQTKEDAEKLTQYRVEAERKKLKSNLDINNVLSWTKELKIELQYKEVNQTNIERVLQLVNKTNQMNMATNRYTMKTFSELLNEQSRNLYCISAKDKFGEYGVIGFVSYLKNNNTLVISDFLISCRAMGRYIEFKILKDLFEITNDLATVSFNFTATKSNSPMQSFLNGITLNSLIAVPREFIVKKIPENLPIVSEWRI